jgi:hypothetical protein
MLWKVVLAIEIAAVAPLGRPKFAGSAVTRTDARLARNRRSADRAAWLEPRIADWLPGIRHHRSSLVTRRRRRVTGQI